MENTNYAQALAERILALRKEKGLTQEALAGQLGVSFQAVSKWENGQSCPDIALLPLLADIFAVPIDSLFGRQAPAEQPAPVIIEQPVFATGFDLPWGDDRELRGVVYWGNKLLGHEKIRDRKFTFNASEYTWILRYSPLNVHTKCGLHIEGDVQGNANAGGGINCGNIGGDANPGGGINCGNIGGDANPGGGMNCGNVGGDANAGGGINCGVIKGNANAGGDIECGDIKGNASAGNVIKCKRIGGDAQAEKIVMKRG